MDEQFSSIIDLVDDSVICCDIMNVHLNNYFLS